MRWIFSGWSGDFGGWVRFRALASERRHTN
jgi:hypothetical protein